MLRIVELRARLYGLLDRDRAGAAARLVVSDSGNRKLELEFVLSTHNGARLSLIMRSSRGSHCHHHGQP